MMFAAAESKLECLKLLLDAAANVNLQYNTGETALHCILSFLLLSFRCVLLFYQGAAYWGNLKSCEMLVAAGADISIENLVISEKGKWLFRN